MHARGGGEMDGRLRRRACLLAEEARTGQQANREVESVRENVQPATVARIAASGLFSARPALRRCALETNRAADELLLLDGAVVLEKLTKSCP